MGAITLVCKIVALSNLGHWPYVQETISSPFHSPEDIVSKEIMEWHSLIVKFRFVELIVFSGLTISLDLRL